MTGRVGDYDNCRFVGADSFAFHSRDLDNGCARPVKLLPMLALLLRIVANMGTVATAGGVLISEATLRTLVKSGLWGLIILAAIVCLVDIILYYRARPRRYPPQSPMIHKFMCRWLSQGGYAAVFSRDLSWVTSDSEAASILGTRPNAES